MKRSGSARRRGQSELAPALRVQRGFEYPARPFWHTRLAPHGPEPGFSLPHCAMPSAGGMSIHKELNMRHYEVVFMVHPDQSEQVPAMIERYRGMIAAGSGKVHRLEGLGRRQVASPIPQGHKAQ